MSDVLVVTAPVPSRYPTVNHLGADNRRGGKKTPEYARLFTDVKDAAEAEMARTGWEPATYYCDLRLTLYRNTRITIDCGNLGKCEQDALVEAGVLVNDKWVRPFVADIEYDPAGESRVVIVVRRRFPDLHFTADAPAKQPPAARLRAQGSDKPKPAAPKPSGAQIGAQEAIFGRTWLENGRPMSESEIQAAKRKLGIA